MMSGIDDKSWLRDYFARYASAFDPMIFGKLIAFRDLALDARAAKKKLIFAGNGASASISAHARVDFTKQAKCRAIDFNEPNLITAFSNDYGFENFMARALEFFADDGDVVVLTSVSGRSANCINAAEYARKRGLRIVALTGKEPDNPLRKLADVDLWYDSHAYNVVECVHMAWLCSVIDMIVGTAEYSVS